MLHVNKRMSLECYPCTNSGEVQPAHLTIAQAWHATNNGLSVRVTPWWRDRNILSSLPHSRYFRNTMTRLMSRRYIACYAGRRKNRQSLICLQLWLVEHSSVFRFDPNSLTFSFLPMPSALVEEWKFDNKLRKLWMLKHGLVYVSTWATSTATKCLQWKQIMPSNVQKFIGTFLECSWKV